MQEISGTDTFLMRHLNWKSLGNAGSESRIPMVRINFGFVIRLPAMGSLEVRSRMVCSFKLNEFTVNALPQHLRVSEQAIH